MGFQEKIYYVYITTNETKSTIYIGVTNDLSRRLSQHYFDSEHQKLSFAGRYNCYYLIYYEEYQSSNEAILREKILKKWRREKKERLINDFNPEWEFLNKRFDL